MDQTAPEEEEVPVEEEGLSGEEIYYRLVAYLASRGMKLAVGQF